MKPNIKTLPCFQQVADVIGVKQANIELWKVTHRKKVFLESNWPNLFRGDLEDSFPWALTAQGYEFWEMILHGINT
jgi:hypothetical protein